MAPSSDGKLVSFFHEGWELTSRPSGYNVAGVDTTARMYACENIATAVNVVHADRNTPGFQRAPAETPYMFGLECAMDELAYALKHGPHRAAPPQRHPDRSGERPALLLPLADAVLRPGGRAVRLEQARSQARAPCATATG